MIQKFFFSVFMKMFTIISLWLKVAIRILANFQSGGKTDLKARVLLTNKNILASFHFFFFSMSFLEMTSLLRKKKLYKMFFQKYFYSLVFIMFLVFCKNVLNNNVLSIVYERLQ